MTKSHPIELACLDMAGTTVQDEGAVERAFLSALDAVGISAEDSRRPAMLDYVTETMGTSKIVVFQALFPDDASTPLVANVAFESTYEAIVEAGEIEAMPGAQEAIDALRTAGIKIALLTGFSATTRDGLIRALKWENIADLLLCPQEAGRGRPYPDMVLQAILTLETSDVAAVAVVGDTAADIETGRRAGASIVAGVLTGNDDKDRLSAAGATHVLDSIGGLPFVLK